MDDVLITILVLNVSIAVAQALHFHARTCRRARHLPLRAPSRITGSTPSVDDDWQAE
jgi:hypothetical protein